MLVVPWAFSKDVVSCFKGLVVAWAELWFWGAGQEFSPEFSCVCMSSSALNDSAEHLSFVFEVEEVFCGVVGWRDAVRNGESAFLGGRGPFSLPEFQC